MQAQSTEGATTTKTRRWVVRSAIVALGIVPLPSLIAYGCNSPTQFDDLCGWLKDENNCYREYFIDIGTRCGVAAPATRVGAFAGRDKLGECFLQEGGIIQFEPPIDFAAPPPDNAEPLKFKIVNADSTQCGVIEFRAEFDFTMTINGDPIPADADADSLPKSFVFGGTFSEVGGKDTDILDVACPSGDKFKFDRLQVTRCRDVEPILPHAEIDFSPGGVEQTGVVRLNIFYPPPEGALSGAQPVPINYFECFIPAAPPACANGVKDGAETDVDCGGGFCTQRCDDGQMCITDDDCISAACVVDMGIKKCAGG